jgi:hypothetical protein
MQAGDSNSRFVSVSASEALFRQPVPPELDPAQLLTELRNARPLIDRVHRAAPVLDALEGLTPGRVQEFRLTMQDTMRTMARLDHADAQLHRIEELIQLLDELEVLVRRQ